MITVIQFCQNMAVTVSEPCDVIRVDVLNKYSEKNIFTIIFVVKSPKGFGWNNVGPASPTVAQHYISIGPMYRAIWCFCHRDGKLHQHNSAVRKYGTFAQCCFNDGPAS